MDKKELTVMCVDVDPAEKNDGIVRALKMMSELPQALCLGDTPREIPVRNFRISPTLDWSNIVFTREDTQGPKRELTHANRRVLSKAERARRVRARKAAKVARRLNRKKRK